MICDDIVLLEFLRCELGEEQQEEVWQHLEACEECSARIKVLAALEALHREKRRGHRKVWRSWVLAAALLLSLAVPLSMLNHPGRETAAIPADPAGMATSEPYPQFPLQTRSPAESSREQEVAFQAYNSGDLRQAEVLFNNLKPSVEVSFYLGVTQYLLAKHDLAIESLTRPYQSTTEWRDPAAWYLANAYLRRREPEQARRFLSEIGAGHSVYRERAKTLLERLGP
jgi:hypothetical protein